MSTTPSSLDGKAQRKRAVDFSNAAVILAMACAGFGYAQLLTRLGVDAAYLTLFSLLLAAETFYSFYHIKDIDGNERIIFRAAELLTIPILLKIFLLFRNGLDQLPQEIAAWQQDFFGSFFSGEYIAALFLFVLIWIFSTILAQDIEILYDNEQDAAWDEIGKVQNTLHLYRRRIAANLFILGGFVVFFAAAARLNLRQSVPFLQGQFNPDVPVFNVLLYFILVLVLLSQTQFALLRARWTWRKTPVAPRLPRNWLVYGLIFFGVLALLAFLLPTQYSMGLFDTLIYAINLMMVLVRFLITLILLPIGFCASLFSSNRTEELPPLPPASPQLPPPVGESAANPLWQFIQSFLFWGIFLAVIIFALSQYVRSNKALLAVLSKLSIMPIASKFFKSFWAWLRGANRTLSSLITTGIRRILLPSSLTRKIEKQVRQPGGKTPREQVMQLYLAFLELVRESGPAREAGETPYHYSQIFIADRPDVSAELLDLTEAFVEARYSQHPVDPPKVPLLQTIWKRIREKLKKPAPNQDAGL